MAPSRTITTEITHARTGRSMKKRASMIVFLFPLTPTPLPRPGERGRGEGVGDQGFLVGNQGAAFATRAVPLCFLTCEVGISTSFGATVTPGRTCCRPLT